MSLFGSSPEDAGLTTSNTRSEQKSSLFDDEAPTTRSSGGLFNDESANGDSPWSIPNSKRASRGDMVKTLLQASDVPESYVDAYDTLSASEHKADGGNIRMSAVQKVLEASIGAQGERDKILRLVGGGPVVGRNEFNVLLALIGLAQEGDEVSLDSVDERRKGEHTECESWPKNSTDVEQYKISPSHLYPISTN